MIASYFNHLNLLDLRIFLSSALFFFIGYALAPTAYYKKISWLTAYPLWIANKLEKIMEHNWKPVLLFLFIFLVNSFSLTIDFLSCLAPFLPPLFAVWTGFNIGIISYHTLGGPFYYASLLNPVALLELPAAFVTFTLAIQYNLQLFSIRLSSVPSPVFSVYLKNYLLLVLPLLLLAGLLESWLIKMSKKMENHN